MPQRDVFSHVQVDVNAGSSLHAAVPSDDTPFHVAILGDFSGRADELPGSALADRRPLRIDRDDLDVVLARIAPELALDIGGEEPLRIRFTALDDFHPDSLHARLPVFTALRDLRRRLADPRTFAAAAAELRPAARVTGADTAPGPSIALTAARLAGGSLLDEIVAAAPGDVSTGHGDGRGSGGGDLAGFLRRIVSPHLVPDADPRQQELQASVDAATTALLRLILAHPRFRALEALWRGVDLLVRRLETSATLRLAIIDASRAQLAAAVASHPADVRDGIVYRMLADGARALPDGAPWSLLVGLHPASEDTGGDDETALLDGLAGVAAACGAPWITAAPAALVRPRADHAMTGWETLRRSAHGRWLGLAHPAVLLRLPYGKEGESCDALPSFEELEPGLDASGAADALLWGSPALVPALVLGAAFAADGWAMRPADHVEVDRLPLYLHHGGGSVTAVPPNGDLLDEDEVQRLLDGGVMPVVARRDGDAVRLASLHCVADPPTALAGRWRSSSH